jgi:alpha-D-xyloside xylohydrolase
MYSRTTNLPAGKAFVVTSRFRSSASFKAAEANSKVILTTRKLKVSADQVSGAVVFYGASVDLLLSEPAGGGRSMTAATANGESAWQPEQSFARPADEFLYGLGQFREGIWNWRGVG